MNEQLPPQSIEDQIRVLDGLFSSMANSANTIQVNTGAVGAQNFQLVMDEAYATGITFTTTTSGQQGWMQGDVLTVIDGRPVWEQVNLAPKKKNFFDLMTITRDE